MGGFFDVIPGGDLVTAGAALGSSIIQSNANKRINEQNIQMQRETNALQRQMFERNLAWQRESQDLQNEYNSLESQVQRALMAGVSPAALFESSSGSVPASTGSPGSGIPNLTAPHADFVKEPLSEFVSQAGLLAKVMSDVSQSQLNDQQKNEIVSLLQGKIKQLNLSNDAQEIANGLQLQFGDKKLQAEIDLMVAQASKEIAEVSLNQQMTLTEVTKRVNLIADTMLKQVQTQLSKKELDTFMQRFNLWKQDVIEGIKVKRTQQTENLASAEEHRAGAENKREQANLYRAQSRIADVQAWFDEQKRDFWKDPHGHQMEYMDADGNIKYRYYSLSDFFGTDFEQKLMDLRYKNADTSRLYSEFEKIKQEGELIKTERQWYGVKTCIDMLSKMMSSGSDLLGFFRPRLSSSDVEVDSKPYDYIEEDKDHLYLDERGEPAKVHKKRKSFYRRK